jgi:hypothetical protein
MCKALCPNAETNVYTYPASGDIDQAVSIDGQPYKSLPNAGKYRTKFDPKCACKPPNQSWVQALAQAEALLGRQPKSDLIVTPEKAEELSRPKTRPSAWTPKILAAPSQAPDDPATAMDAAASASAPTASNASSGISAGKIAPSASYGLSDGEMREAKDPDGTPRRVRVIAPKL